MSGISVAMSHEVSSGHDPSETFRRSRVPEVAATDRDGQRCSEAGAAEQRAVLGSALDVPAGWADANKGAVSPAEVDQDVVAAGGGAQVQLDRVFGLTESFDGAHRVRERTGGGDLAGVPVVHGGDLRAQAGRSAADHPRDPRSRTGDGIHLAGGSAAEAVPVPRQGDKALRD